MFKWNEVQTLGGFTQEMTTYRNSMVREISFVFSENYAKLKEDRRIEDDYIKIKTVREKAGDRIIDPLKKSKVGLELLIEVFNQSLDFTSAEMFIKHFGLSIEDIGKDVYYEMKDEKSPYSKYISEEKYNIAFEFLRFFPLDDSLTELDLLIKLAIKNKNNEGIVFLIDKLGLSEYKKLIKDEELSKQVSDEFDRAVNEKRIDDGFMIVNVLNDTDKESRLRVITALTKNNYEDAIVNLREVKEKEKLHDVLKEYCEEEIRAGKNDIEHYVRAFALAFHGGLTKGDKKYYVEHPSGILFKHYINSSVITEVEMLEIEKYMKTAKPVIVMNELASRLLALIQGNETFRAKELKERLNIKFKTGEYDIEKEVRDYFRQLTETKGMFELPKGEENLKTAYDVAKIFNFTEKEAFGVRKLLCKYYIINKKYDKAKKHFIPEDEEILEIMESQITRLINSKDFVNPYILKRALPIKFSREFKSAKKQDVKTIIKNQNISSIDLAKAIFVDDIFELKSIPQNIYDRTFGFALDSDALGIKLLVDLKDPFLNRMDSVKRIKIDKKIKELMSHDIPLAESFAKAYGDVLPPNICHWLIYIFRKIFGAA